MCWYWPFVLNPKLSKIVSSLNLIYLLQTHRGIKICYFSYLNTVGLNMYEKCLHKQNIFLIPLYISELTTSQKNFLTFWPPGCAIITFAENWNYELNFLFWWILLDSKLPLGYFGSIFHPKMGLWCPKPFTHLVAKSTVQQCNSWAFWT